MKIVGMIKASFIDYPGKAATVIFLGGCNFNCGYCHNPEIVRCKRTNQSKQAADQRESEASEETQETQETEIEEIDREAFFAFLLKRKRFLDGVCISGGEPTIHSKLYELVRDIKALGYFVKLDTNGSNPQMLERLLVDNLLDYVAMDVKGPLPRYEEIVRQKVDTDAVLQSIGLLKAADIAYEFRTTVAREQLALKDLKEMKRNLLGAGHWYLQSVKKQGAFLDEVGTYTAYSSEEMACFVQTLNEEMESDQGRKQLCVSAR